MKTKIFVAGHKGMVGSSIQEALVTANATNLEIITADRSSLDLTNSHSVQTFFERHRFDEVYLAAAKVGGIHANNTFPAEFIYENLMIECNIIHSAYLTNVNKLLFLGSSCIYPRFSEQPIAEDSLLTSKLEPTNEPYAIAKIAGIKLCESYNRQYGCDFRSVMPTNLYGPNDNFHPINSHVIPAMLRRFHEAKINNAPSVTIWGTGKPKREFLHVKDMAAACIHVMNLEHDKYHELVTPMQSHINIGYGEDISILDLAYLIKDITEFNGTITTNPEKPDGTPRKQLNVSKIQATGWQPKINLASGLKSTYQWFLNHQDNFRQ